ncbi:hypothetical protein, partial [Membranihabitans maritimus]|uniref:hypothetical protein n=1 Tax=Membranihabitans maritimus TaxID=2904244 RepID=UPI001F3CAA48
LLQLGNAMLASALITQKYSHDPTRLLTQVRTIFSTLESWMGRNLLEDLIVYFIELIEVKEEQFNIIVDKIPEIMKTAFISTADRIRQRGMKEGTQQTKKQVVQNMLRKGSTVDFICDVLEVAPEFVEQVRKEMEV